MTINGLDMKGIFLIGSVPSSGSTLLVNLLSRIDGVLCLPETGLFVHARDLVEQGVSQRQQADLRWHLPWLPTKLKVAGTLGWEPGYYEQLSSRYANPFEMVRACIDPEGHHWIIEKTPENVFAFYNYLAASQSNRVVVTSRDAAAVAQSLGRRGFNLLEALLVWFSHSYQIACLLTDFPGQVYHCRYAELTRQPEVTVAAIVDFLGIRDARPSVRGNDPTMQTEGSHDAQASDRKDTAPASVSVLRDISYWHLTDTAWSYSPNSAVEAGEPVNLYGIALEMMVDLLAFETPAHGVVTVLGLDEILQKDLPLAAGPQPEVEAVNCELSSVFTQTLARHYPPFLARI